MQPEKSLHAILFKNILFEAMTDVRGWHHRNNLSYHDEQTWYYSMTITLHEYKIFKNRVKY